MNTHQRHLESGMPLGGIGAGTIEFCADGRFTNITINNNWDTPIIDGSSYTPFAPRIREGFIGSVAENASRRKALFSAEGLPGAWIAVHTPISGALVLKTVSRPAFSTIPLERIKFNANFPLALVEYAGFDEIHLKLEAFSAIDIPDTSNCYRNSSLPLSIFHFQVCNDHNEELPISLAFSWQNLNGIGGYAGTPINNPDLTPPQYRMEKGAPGLWFDHAHDSLIDLRVLGDYSLRVWTDVANKKITYFTGWDPSGDGHDIWDCFARTGHLSESETNGTAGALAVNISLKPGELGNVLFALAWHMPHLLAAVDECEYLVGPSSAPPDPGWVEDTVIRSDYGHAYSIWFDNSWEIAGFGLNNWKSIRKRLYVWQETIQQSNLPEFFKNSLCNDLFPLFSNTWYTMNRQYAINEAPTEMKGCMSSIDQRSVANAAVASFFPELNRKELELFAADQICLEDDPRRFGFHWNTMTGRFDKNLDRLGAILHEVGWDHLEGGRTGRQKWLTAHWPDLTSVFVLQLYQHAIWNDSSDWLDVMYPHIKSALRFQARLDQNGNGVPNLWGAGCCTYDTEMYPFFGSSPFIVTLYLSALRAAERMAIDRGDVAYIEETRELISKAHLVLEEQLWDKNLGYYRAWQDHEYEVWNNTPMSHGPESQSCHIGQLAGAWWSDLLCLGDIVDPERRKRSLENIGHLNLDQVSGCPANEFFPDGTYSESWPSYGLVYFAAQAISVGLADVGWRAVEKIYRVRRDLDGSLWDSPLGYAGEGNEKPQWGRWYMSNPASWYLLLALSGIRIDRIHKELRVAPFWPTNFGNDLLSIPIFLPGLQILLTSHRTNSSLLTNLRFDRIHKPLSIDRITSLVPSHMNPNSVEVRLSGINEESIMIEENGQICICGTFVFENSGETVTIEVIDNSIL